MDQDVTNLALERVIRKLKDAKQVAERLPTDGTLPILINMALSEAKRLHSKSSSDEPILKGSK